MERSHSFWRHFLDSGEASDGSSDVMGLGTGSELHGTFPCKLNAEQNIQERIIAEQLSSADLCYTGQMTPGEASFAYEMQLSRGGTQR